LGISIGSLTQQASQEGFITTFFHLSHLPYSVSIETLGNELIRISIMPILRFDTLYVTAQAAV
jgi:hypothetical protein